RQVSPDGAAGGRGRDGSLPADAAQVRGVPRRFPPRRVPGVRAVTRFILISFAVVSLLATVALGHHAAAAAGDDDDTVDVPMVKRKRPSLSVPGKRALTEANGVTRCGACHMVEGWEKVRFNHDPTGFPLRGNTSTSRAATAT